jgi:hypothetical protein
MLAHAGAAPTTLDDLGDGIFRKVRRALGVTSFGANGIVLPPGTSWFERYHERKDELYFVHDGRTGFEVEGETFELGPGGLVRRVHGTTPVLERGRHGPRAARRRREGWPVERDGHMVDPADEERRRAVRRATSQATACAQATAGGWRAGRFRAAAPTRARRADPARIRHGIVTRPCPFRTRRPHRRGDRLTSEGGRDDPVRRARAYRYAPRAGPRAT